MIDDFYDRYITKMAGRSKEWEYLSYHAALAKQYADIYMDRFNHDDDACREKIAQFNQQVNRIAVATDSVLDDVFLMGDVENNLFGWRRTI